MTKRYRVKTKLPQKRAVCYVCQNVRVAGGCDGLDENHCKKCCERFVAKGKWIRL